MRRAHACVQSESAHAVIGLLATWGMGVAYIYIKPKVWRIELTSLATRDDLKPLERGFSESK